MGICIYYIRILVIQKFFVRKCGMLPSCPFYVYNLLVLDGITEKSFVIFCQDFSFDMF